MTRLGLIAPLMLCMCGALYAGAALAHNPSSKAKLQTNEHYIQNIQVQDKPIVQNPHAVFQYVFQQLPDEVQVYPTENYYYIRFHHQGLPYAGNFRLDALDRDQGVMHFAYFNDYNRWSDGTTQYHKAMNQEDGLKVEKIEPLRYRVTHKNKSVVFQLNDLRHVQPPPDKIHADERCIGPVYDESGMQFYLLYNKKSKNFHYILNQEQAIPDRLVPSPFDPRIQVGQRTGFAYLQDAYQKRLILIGVYEGNAMVNNYFDGPFDQLPDNFIQGNTLREALIHQRPELQGQIDRFGNTEDGSTRVLITPYLHYSTLEAFHGLSLCTKQNKENKKNDYEKCLKRYQIEHQNKHETHSEESPS